MIRRQTASILVFVALIACAGMNGCPNQDGTDDPMIPGDMNPNPDPNPNSNDDGNGNSNSTPPPPNGNGNGNTNDNVNDNSPPPPPPRDPPQWNPALGFDTTAVGALSSVWGSGPNDVFVVGGSRDPSMSFPCNTPAFAEVYHFNGISWTKMALPSLSPTDFICGSPLFMVWVFGFSSDDVYAVGLGGHMLHYDGTSWTWLNTGTGFDLWGIWGASPTDMWIVGEGPSAIGGQDSHPTLIHYDGNQFSKYDIPTKNFQRPGRDLFKVWGIGSKLFAVGDGGLIIEYNGISWDEVLAGPQADDDFVSLWGTSENNIVAVGGRSAYRLSVYEGTGWTTRKPSNPLGQPAMNAVFMDEDDMAIIGGINGDGSGYLGHYNPVMNAPVGETASAATQAIHAIWGDGMGRYYAVGGDFSTFTNGICLVRTYGPPG